MSHEEDEVELNPSDDTVLNKYIFASQSVKTVLNKVIEKCQVGASIRAICREGDEMLIELTKIHYKNHSEMKKGIAFPTSLNVNNIMCHYSPNNEDQLLKEGDVVKINLGAHVDGFPAIVGHTVVIGASAENPVKGRVADAMICAHRCYDAIMKMLRPGEDNTKITEIVEAISSDFNCKLIEGIECHRMAQHNYDCDKMIMFNANEEQKKRFEKCKFELFEVWLIDVIVSTGEGKPRDGNKPSTIFKKTDSAYQLKLKTSRQIFHEIITADLNFPFNIAVLSDQKKARMAMNECITHGLIQEFPVMTEKTGETVVQFKSTVLLMKDKPLKLVDPTFKPSLFSTELKVKNEEAKKILNRSMKYSSK